MKRIALLLLAIFAANLAPHAAAAEMPNVVLVITDDQGYGDLSCTGNPTLKTPNIDALAEQAVRLTDYHVAPTCSPTRSALQTGHWTNRTGVWHTIMGRSMLRANEVTMGQVFKDAGYATGMFGKWHLGDNYPYRPEDRGYSEVMRHGGGGVGQTPDYWDNAYFDGSYFHNSQPEAVEGFCTDVFFDYAKRFILEQKRHEAENPARLTSHDWITTGSTPWNQARIRGATGGAANTGFWHVKVMADGEYEIRLRRWPAESDTAIDAGRAPGSDVPGVTPYRARVGKAVPIRRATLQIGQQQAELPVAADAKEVVFQVKLAAGKTRLSARFLTEDGAWIGAYYAYVRKL